MEAKNAIREILIVGLTPYFLEKPVLWFKRNRKRIIDAAKTQKFWKDNILILEKNQKLQLSELLRKLDDLGYEKVQTISQPGEFSSRGGMIDITPINLKGHVVRMEFLGNRIENIQKHEIKFDKKQFEKDLKLRLNRESLKNLKPGDFLVHLDHGIGQYAGITTQKTEAKSQLSIIDDRQLLTTEKSYKKSGGEDQKYYILEYAAGDKLYVPIGLEKKLSRYIGFTEPKISRLGSPMWERTKRKIKEDTIKLAKELLAIYAKREIASRPAYPGDPEMEKDLKSSFEFQETPDQEMALEEILRDMSQERPVDRVICGDVGFGKTEVALRAAFKAAISGKQVAILAPTTILVDQHFNTFKKRLEKYPIEIAMLSRFETKSRQREIIKDIKEGKIDIIIGTHRILSKDVEFQNLGLLIIDEEQRFGVRQKEKFKNMRAEVDVLSLSATPIPRTLYLSLSNLRNISIIQTPPPGREPIKTFIKPWSKDLIREAVKKEIERGGQIYYLHNRVETIEMVKKQIEELVPRGTKIGIAHGRLSEKELLSVMTNFRKKKIDLLLATTIIENGLDLPNVNTLIVADATKLGLAQAYQVRGRIGRSHIQAYAYFLYSSKALKEKAAMRLEALKEAEELGSGYQIALRDLEIRGAGNILGKEQSGSINKVGLNLYSQMLAETIEEMKQG